MSFVEKNLNISDTINNWTDKHNKEIQNRLDFFESKNFNKILFDIQQWMIESNIHIITNDDYAYGKAHVKGIGNFNLPVTEDEFNRVVDCIFVVFEEEKIYNTNLDKYTIEYDQWECNEIRGLGLKNLKFRIDRMREIKIDTIVK